MGGIGFDGGGGGFKKNCRMWGSGLHAPTSVSIKINLLLIDFWI